MTTTASRVRKRGPPPSLYGLTSASTKTARFAMTVVAFSLSYRSRQKSFGCVGSSTFSCTFARL